MHFADDMLEAKGELEKMGHEVYLPEDIHECIYDPSVKKDTSSDRDHEKELRHCIEKNLLKDALKKIEKSDAVLFVNKTKNKIEGYMGASGLMELGVSFFLDKKIYLLNNIDKNQKYAMEVELTAPIILNGDLGKIG